MEYQAVINVHLSYNNTIVTLCTPCGIVIDWASGGSIGFKGSRRASSSAASAAVRNIAETCVTKRLRNVSVRFEGVGKGRGGVLSGLDKNKLKVINLVDTTHFPHNGCRPPSRRRL